MRTCTNRALVVSLLLGLTQLALGDFYDQFSDGQYCQDPNEPNAYDPNLWDADNPHWITQRLQAVGSASFSAQNGGLEIRADGGGYTMFLSTYVDSGNHDANTSDTWFDSNGSFYLLSRVSWPVDANDPNDPNCNGASILGICLDPNQWACYGMAFNPRDGQAILGSLSFSITAVAQLASTYKTGLNPREGVWTLLAHTVQQSDPNNPNTITKSLRGALWSGGKFDWNGQYDVQYDYVVDSNAVINANLIHPDGLVGFGVAGFAGWTCAGRTVDVSFDEVECRRGSFSNQSATLELGVVNGSLGTIDVEPNLPDPNDTDPNMPYTMRYTLGTQVVLTATPNPGKEFDYWQILDPNHPYDANYGTFDSNGVLHLTMNEDVQVLARFKCGSGLGFGLMAALLPVTILWLAMRRRT